mgnify:FL=1
MGLLRAATTSVASGFGDQFKEFVTCPTIEKNVLIQRGTVQHGKGNSNPSEGVISNGSKIVVPQGMAMMIIDNGAIKEFSAEPGEFIYDTSSEPSVFTGGFFKGIGETIKTIGSRITYGGQTARDQRVYYVNLLTITGNKFGSPQPRKITDDKYGILEVTFFGQYAFKVVDPVILVQNVIGANAKDTVTYEEIVGDQLKSSFIGKISEAITVVMRKNHVSFGDILMYNTDIANEMNVVLDESWRQNYGLEITDVAIADLNLTDESLARVNKVDDATIFSNSSLQSGLMASATADAMKAAASNSNGAMTGFMGMGFAQNTGATAMGAINQNPSTSQQGATFASTNTPEPGTIFAGATAQSEEIKAEEPVQEQVNPQVTEETPAKRFCSNCGNEVTGKFCTNCGTKAGE